jgi:Ca2+-transporting ATPase
MPTVTEMSSALGLTESEAAARLVKDGPNQLELARRRSLERRLFDLLRQPMFALLVLAAALYLLLGDFSEGLTLAVFVLAVIGLTFYQEGRTENAIAALRELTGTRACVMRDGTARDIPAREVVCGDILLLAEGDRVAADGRMLEAHDLQVDESLLTGESVPVNKCAGVPEPDSESGDDDGPGGDNRPWAYAATFVVRGHGRLRVTAIGANSQVGRISRSLAQVDDQQTPLQAQTARLVKTLAGLALILCALMITVLGIRSGQWLPALLSGIALAMAILPEEYPVVLTVFPALGAHRLTRDGVLTRRINALETLGATSVLCTDKTGTLTENRMRVSALIAGPAIAPKTLHWPLPDGAQLPDVFHGLIEHAILASAPQPFDPMETAFHHAGHEYLKGSGHLHSDWHLAQSYALTPDLKAVTQAWKGVGAHHVISSKGAPEAVMDLCHLSEAERKAWLLQVEALAARGLRVLGVARGRHAGEGFPASPHDFDFVWEGLIGLSDPLRAGVPAAVAECRSAGIRVILITGDYPLTARVIADEAGLPEGDLLTGTEMLALDDEALRERLRTVNVCARIAPEQKLRIVHALQAAGEVVAMTGDGVNDAPALRAAHVGVAMGARGTDVAREAAALVLTDDDFSSIVRGIRTGRRIFANLRKAMAYIFAIHIPIAGIALLPMLLGLPPLLLPLHIALLELIIDPSCAIAFEREPAESRVMAQAPRDTRAPLFGAADMFSAASQGLCVLTGLAGVYAWANFGQDPLSEAQTRALVFVTLVVSNAALILVNRAPAGGFLASLRVPNRTAYVIILLALALAALTIHWPWLRAAMDFAPLTLSQQSVAVATGVAVLVAAAGLRWLGKSLRKS